MAAMEILLLDELHNKSNSYNKLEEFCLLGYVAMFSGESQPTFRKNNSSPSSGSRRAE
jgi:hypothetical protein